MVHSSLCGFERLREERKKGFFYWNFPYGLKIRFYTFLSLNSMSGKTFMAFKFENLNIWRRSLELSIEINELAKVFPSFELYNLSNQIRRAADSVVLNIAEGSTGQTNAEFNKFLGYSLRSAVEVVSCLFIAQRKGYITEIIFSKHYYNYEILRRMITKLRTTLV
jgi:four helix bundle protein